MEYHLNLNIDCPKHGRLCPDRVLNYAKGHQDYGIRIPDGGSSYYIINFCPFCGKQLGDKQSGSSESLDIGLLPNKKDSKNK